MRTVNEFKVSDGQSLYTVDKIGTPIHIGNHGAGESLCGVKISSSPFDLHLVVGGRSRELRKAPLDYMCLRCIAKERDGR